MSIIELRWGEYVHSFLLVNLMYVLWSSPSIIIHFMYCRYLDFIFHDANIGNHGHQQVRELAVPYLLWLAYFLLEGSKFTSRFVRMSQVLSRLPNHFLEVP